MQNSINTTGGMIGNDPTGYNVWSRCSNCKTQKFERKTQTSRIYMGEGPCPKCGSIKQDAVIGGEKPEWWVEGAQGDPVGRGDH